MADIHCWFWQSDTVKSTVLSVFAIYSTLGISRKFCNFVVYGELPIDTYWIDHHSYSPTISHHWSYLQRHKATTRTSVVLPRDSLTTCVGVRKTDAAYELDSVLTKVLFSTPKGLLESPVMVIAGAAIPSTVEDAYILPYTVSISTLPKISQVS